MMQTLDMNKHGTQHFLFKLQPGNRQKASKLYQETSPHRHLKNDPTFRLLIAGRYKHCSHMDTHTHGIAIPLQAWTGPEGSRRFRLPDFKIVGT